jgi:SSS family solute:Na+ symporter
MMSRSSGHFHMMIFKRKMLPSLPGLTVLFGGMWIVNLNCGDVISIYNAKSARSRFKTARRSEFYCCILKLLMRYSCFYLE